MAEQVYKLSDLASGKLDLKSLLENVEMNAVEGVIEGVDKKTPKQVSNEVDNLLRRLNSSLVFKIKPPKGHAPFEIETYKLFDEVQRGKKDLEDLSEEDREQVKFLMNALESEKNTRSKKTEGSLMVPPEMPVDTYTPEDQANAEETQLPDDEMEEDYIDFVFSEALKPEEQEYLMETLAADSKLSQIFDKVVETASEFTGSGEVEGPGTGVSDSIPARLSDGEFVMTRKATDQIGADNLQVMMDDAERAYDGGLQRKNEGGLLSRPEEEELEENPEEEEINQLMMGANRMPSIR